MKNFLANKIIVVGLLALGLSVFAQAAPISYTMTVDQVTGTANGVSVGPGATVVIVVQSDTGSVTNNGSGRVCAPGTSGTISINGGAAQALSGTYYVCANSATGDNVGVYPTLYGTQPVHGGNGGAGTGQLTGAPVVTLVNNLGPVSYVANTVHSHSQALNLQAGGTYFANAPEPGSVASTTASTFQVALTVIAPVPALGIWGLLLLGTALLLLGIGAVMARPRSLES
jgi:hypothetical protein